ncbi:MAG: isoleucine--tRNA ligase, partial [Acidobacteria bacterium]
SPEEFVKESGADILRLWTTSSDYREDMRCSTEILQRVAEGYRKLRNTARFALGNLDGFDPARDSVAEEEMLEIDHWALAKLDEIVSQVNEAYKTYEFHTVYHALYNFCIVTLSARYFDIIKDRLYTAASRSHARRSAQTVLYRIADALARMLAPILIFTSDEIWENLPQVRDEEPRLASVHLAELPVATEMKMTGLLVVWAQIFMYRDLVLAELEKARTSKLIGSSLEARVELSAGSYAYNVLDRYREQLRYIFIVSEVLLSPAGEDIDPEHIIIAVSRAEGAKCERCWNYSTRVGESARYPTVCERCVEALNEIEREEAA